MKNKKNEVPEVLSDLKLSEKQKRFLDKYPVTYDESNIPMNDKKIFHVNHHGIDEVIRVHAIFFEKSPAKQRKTLRIFVSWAIKHYFKILFK